jgi:uncharacterized protein (DUF111 family)
MPGGINKKIEAPGEVRVIETNIDDMGGEVFGFLMERLLEEQVLDVWYTPIYMKKNRPAVKVSVLCHPKDEERISRLLLQETTTLGVRSYSAQRKILNREWVQVDTQYGPISFKAATSDSYAVSKGAPEFEDCRRAARMHGVPLRVVYEAALRAYAKQTFQSNK